MYPFIWPKQCGKVRPKAIVRKQLLKYSLALFVIAPLINVGPVNVTALLLLLASLSSLSIQPRLFFRLWGQYWPFMLIMLTTTSAFLLSNLLSNNPSPFDSTFAQARWFLLLAIATPAVAYQLNAKDWRDIVYFSAGTILVFAMIYLIDAYVYLGLGSNFILDLIDARRGDLMRPSWVFNPHPFSRTLIAAMLLLLGGALAFDRSALRNICYFGILGLGVLLVLGAVRTAFVAVAVIACLGVIFYKGKRLMVGLCAGLFLSAAGLWFRGQLFPMAQADKSLELREALLEQGLQAFMANPWVGGGYQAARAISWPDKLQRFADTQTMATTNTHLQWLEMLVSYGLLGGLLFAALWLFSGWLVLTASLKCSSLQKLAGVLLFLNWTSLTIGSFTTVFRESEWALWLVTVLAALSLLEQKKKSSQASMAANVPHGA